MRSTTAGSVRRRSGAGRGRGSVRVRVAPPLKRTWAVIFIAPDQGDVLDEEPDHPFLLPVRRMGIVPQAGEVGGEADDLLAPLLVEPCSVGCRLAFVVLLGLGQGPELGVPVGLQGVGHEAVVGIDPAVAALGELGLVACRLEFLATQAIHFFAPGPELVAHREGDLEAQGRHDLDE